MLADERYAKISLLLKERGFIEVEELVELLGVSVMTVRRDLEKCQQAGLLKRCHGGAVLVGIGQQEVSFEDKSIEKSDAKQKLAGICAKLVKEGMSVFLDAGTTNYEIAKKLRLVPRLTVVTNDIRIGFLLLNSSVDLLMVGGAVQKTTGSIVGHMADRMIEGMHVDVAFIGVNSINDQFDVMTPTLEKAYFKRKVLSCASTGYLVADSSKFHRNALHKVNSLDVYTAVITDYRFSTREEDALRKRKIDTITA